MFGLQARTMLHKQTLSRQTATMTLDNPLDVDDDVHPRKTATRVYTHNAPGYTPMLAIEVAYVGLHSPSNRQDNYLGPPKTAFQPLSHINNSRASLPPITYNDTSGSSAKSFADLSRTVATTLTAAEFTAKSEKIRDQALDEFNLMFHETMAGMEEMHNIHCATATEVFRLTKDISYWSKERSDTAIRREQTTGELAKLLQKLTVEIKIAHHDRLALELKLTHKLQGMLLVLKVLDISLKGYSERLLLEKETVKQRQIMAKRGYRAKDGTWKGTVVGISYEEQPLIFLLYIAIPLSAMLEPTTHKEEAMVTSKIEERLNHM